MLNVKSPVLFPSYVPKLKAARHMLLSQETGEFSLGKTNSIDPHILNFASSTFQWNSISKVSKSHAHETFQRAFQYLLKNAQPKITRCVGNTSKMKIDQNRNIYTKYMKERIFEKNYLSLRSKSKSFENIPRMRCLQGYQHHGNIICFSFLPTPTTAPSP